MALAAQDTVRLLGFNLEHDGGEDDSPGSRWHRAHTELMVPGRYDGIFRQEMTYSSQDDKARLKASCELLGMRGWVASTGQGRNPTGLFLRESTFPTATVHPQEKVWRTPPTNVRTHLADVPEVDLVLASGHTSFCSVHGREQETEELSSLLDKVKYGASFIAELDCNSYEVQQGAVEPPIDWTAPEITDLVHRRHRTRKQPDGTYASDRYLDEYMLDCGAHDPARYVAREFDKPEAMAATAGHASDGQGHGSRIDRFYMDAWMVTAVEDVRVIRTDGLSDHHAVEVILSRRGMVAALRRQVRPEPAFFSLAV